MKFGEKLPPVKAPNNLIAEKSKYFPKAYLDPQVKFSSVKRDFLCLWKSSKGIPSSLASSNYYPTLRSFHASSAKGMPKPSFDKLACILVCVRNFKAPGTHCVCRRSKP